MNLNILKMLKTANVPDAYTMTVYYVDGHSDAFELVSHTFLQGNLIEITKIDDCFDLIPLAAVKRVSFDARFTKLVEAKRAEAQKEQK